LKKNGEFRFIVNPERLQALNPVPGRCETDPGCGLRFRFGA